jgi:hypothetical protein
MAPLDGLTHRMTDALAVLFRNRRPAGRCRYARGRTGACDLIAPLCVKRPERGGSVDRVS